MTVGQTGSKKSPLLRALIDGPLAKLQAEAKAQYQQELTAWLKLDKKMKKEISKPIQNHLLVQNVTEESLEMIL